MVLEKVNYIILGNYSFFTFFVFPFSLTIIFHYYILTNVVIETLQLKHRFLVNEKFIFIINIDIFFGC